ncbi:MAG: NAD-dependent epimerase/dehydratase family protein [candidate division Zixibacteria bacterium]|nr:NAD-dependent epimerase/dehydratase family protein [candidate division Zixibacteria bacterium]
MKRALITGGAGFIGSHVADALLDKGFYVEIVDNLYTGLKKNVPGKAVFHEMDIRDAAMDEIFQEGKFDIVYHLAAQMDIRKSVADPAFDAEANIIGGINLLQMCKKYKIKKVVFSSTCASYGEQISFPAPESHPQNPASPYGITKLAFEKYLYFYLKEFGLKFVILRYANIYGPRQRSDGEGGVVAIFFERLLAGKKAFIYGDGNQTRDLTYVGDVVNANLMAMDCDRCEAFNVSTGQETTINSLFDIMKDLTGSNQEKIYQPPREGETMRSVLDSSKIRSSMEWRPQHDLQSGLAKTAEFFRAKILS